MDKKYDYDNRLLTLDDIVRKISDFIFDKSLYFKLDKGFHLYKILIVSLCCCLEVINLHWMYIHNRVIKIATCSY